MPTRGSAIGASIGQSVFGGTGGATGRPVSPATAAIYTPQGASTASAAGSMFWSQSKGDWSGPTGVLLILVALEVAGLFALRHGFRHHHGG